MCKALGSTPVPWGKKINKAEVAVCPELSHRAECVRISLEIPRPKGQATLLIGQGDSPAQVLKVAVPQTEHGRGAQCGKSLDGTHHCSRRTLLDTISIDVRELGSAAHTGCTWSSTQGELCRPELKCFTQSRVGVQTCSRDGNTVSSQRQPPGPRM